MKMFGWVKINVNLFIFLLNKKFYGKQIVNKENYVYLICVVRKLNGNDYLDLKNCDVRNREVFEKRDFCIIGVIGMEFLF